MRPLPSDSTTQTVPVSATARFAPEIATRARRNAALRWSLAASASSAGSSPSSGRPSRSRKRSRISVRLWWIAGTSRCDGRSPASWTISSARSVSSGLIPAASSASFSPSSSVVSDLTLTTSRSPVASTSPTTIGVRLGGVAGPVHDAPGARHARLELDQEHPPWPSSERPRIASPASRSSSQSGTSATTRARLALIEVVACATLARGDGIEERLHRGALERHRSRVAVGEPPLIRRAPPRGERRGSPTQRVRGRRGCA